jgi:hypothetical protein
MFASSIDITAFNRAASTRPVLSIANATGSLEGSILTNHDATSAATTYKGPHVGTLPLAVFINIIIGVVIGLLLLPAIISLLRLFRHSETKSKISSPPSIPSFMDTRPTVSPTIAGMVRSEVRGHAQSNRRPPGSPKPSPFIRPDLPLPAPTREKSESPQIDDVTADEIYDCENLVKEKLQLDVKIRNLERLDCTRPQLTIFGGVGVSDRTREALNRRSDLEMAISRALTRFRNRRGTWNAEEWQAVQKIGSLFQ